MAENSQKSLSWKCWDTYVQLSNSVRFIGCNILDFDDRAPPNIYTYLTITLTLVCGIMGITPIFRFSNSLGSIAEGMFTFALAVQAGTKVYMIMSAKDLCYEILNQAQTFVAEFEDNPKVCKIFQKYIEICNWWRPNIFRFYAFIISMMTIMCIAVSVYTRTKIFPFGGILPFLDHQSNIGYVVNFVTYVLISLYGTYGYFASDYYYLNAMATAYGHIETIAVVCEDLTAYLEQHGSDDIQKINHSIALIIKTQHNHSKFMNNLNKQFGFHSFVIITSSMVCIAIAMFLAIQYGWISGVFAIGLFLWQISTLCFVGGIYLIKADNTQIKVIKTKWYLLPVKKQKMFVCIIQYLQNVKEPTALSHFQLNFNTFVLCLKTMYQLLMLLLNVSN
uniref:Odorant receptor n=1 Tax=Phlebotomus papatasi TaxID=29031 RepID=A0A3F2ZEQ3_PHLPP